MFKELINKLKQRKNQLEKYNTSNDIAETKSIEEEKNIDIKISKENNIYKIEISDYISIIDFVDKKNSSDEYNILDLLCNCVLWNNGKQKVNKGIYYIINNDNSLYNILFTDGKIKIDERIKVDLVEQIKKENITQERVITYNKNKDEYYYYSAKHEANGNTYYTRYYNKNRSVEFGELELTEEETYNEINSVICNMENIEGIQNILDVDLLKKYILEDLKDDLNKKII